MQCTQETFICDYLVLLARKLLAPIYLSVTFVSSKVCLLSHYLSIEIVCFEIKDNGSLLIIILFILACASSVLLPALVQHV